MIQTTPDRIDADTRRLMDALPDAGKPVFLDLKHESYAKVSECFPNVREKMKRDGGTLQHGWCVWLAPKMLI
ncbi:hypothetical protein, partial [Novipirellula sp.]|uniref:hypothetical protein n=1 Tax=Novipirellula sp. TaxID=2795430 RepID=UPI0035628DFA